jgi:hypothetical protein
VKVLGVTEKIVTSVPEVLSTIAAGEGPPPPPLLLWLMPESIASSARRTSTKSQAAPTQFSDWCPPTPLPPSDSTRSLRAVIAEHQTNSKWTVSTACLTWSEPPTPATLQSKCLVDLAGSESALKSGSEGLRRTEGSFINKSLLTLSTVIHRLAKGM